MKLARKFSMTVNYDDLQEGGCDIYITYVWDTGTNPYPSDNLTVCVKPALSLNDGAWDGNIAAPNPPTGFKFLTTAPYGFTVGDPSGDPPMFYTFDASNTGGTVNPFITKIRMVPPF